VDAATAASAAALKSRRDGFFVIIVFSLVRALCWERSMARKWEVAALRRNDA
jgi:hypothetical protein